MLKKKKLEKKHANDKRYINWLKYIHKYTVSNLRSIHDLRLKNEVPNSFSYFLFVWETLSLNIYKYNLNWIVKYLKNHWTNRLLVSWSFHVKKKKESFLKLLNCKSPWRTTIPAETNVSLVLLGETFFTYFFLRKKTGSHSFWRSDGLFLPENVLKNKLREGSCICCQILCVFDNSLKTSLNFKGSNTFQDLSSEYVCSAMKSIVTKPRPTTYLAWLLMTWKRWTKPKSSWANWVRI